MLATKNFDTYISFLVKVAVLPVQISVTYPIDSTAARFLTKRLSFFKVSIEKAIAIEIESGRPSGTATIITATAIVKYSKIVLRVSFDKRD